MKLTKCCFFFTSTSVSKHQDGGMYKTTAYPGYPFLMLPESYLPNGSVSPSVSHPDPPARLHAVAPSTSRRLRAWSERARTSGGGDQGFILKKSCLTFPLIPLHPVHVCGHGARFQPVKCCVSVKAPAPTPRNQEFMISDLWESKCLSG